MSRPSYTLLAMLLSLALFGCAHVKDGVEHESAQSRTRTMNCTIELLLRGVVKDSGLDTPISYADVIFIDTGFAPRPVEREWSTRVGTSDRSGQIDQRFVYGWYFETTDEALGVEGKEFGFDQSSKTLEYFDLLDKAFEKVRAAGTFSIEIRKPGYRPERRDIAVRDCAREGDKYLADLGMVTLVPAAVAALKP